MNGLSRLCSSGPTIRIAGRTLELHPWRLRDWGAAEAEILRMRGDVFSLIRSLPVSEGCMGELFKLVRSDGTCASWSDVMTWRQTWSGRLFTLWRSLRLEAAEAASLFVAEADSRGRYAERWWMNEVEPLIAQANGDDEITALYSQDVPTTESDEESDPATQWMRLFSSLCREPFSMNPEIVLDMTFAQAKAVLWSGSGMREFSSFSEIQRHNEAYRQVAVNAARNLKAGRYWNDAGS